MPNDEVHAEIEKALAAAEPVAVATVAQTFGSTPRKTGAKMLVRQDGSFVGTIGGGCGEAEVWQDAMAVLDGGAPSGKNGATNHDLFWGGRLVDSNRVA